MKAEHIIKDSATNDPSFSSVLVQYKRNLLSQISSFSSRPELQNAVDEYCEDPNGWVSNTKYDMYGYVICVPLLI